MADWFDFKGVRSTVNGVRVIEFPPFTLPEERVESQTILGRSGSLTTVEGDDVYNDIVLSIYCFVEDLTHINQISTWLRGEGSLLLGNMTDHYYKARAVNQLSLSKILRNYEHRTFSAIFRCKPYRYVYPAIPSTELINGETITNPGNIDSEPVYIIVATGGPTDVISLNVGGKTINITGLNGSMTIDVEAGVAYETNSDPLVSFTSLVSKEDWPFTIPPGDSVVSWTTTGTAVVSKVKMEPRWRDV
jgi:phage-related protein